MSEKDQAGRDLPSELKAFEASLASLAPRNDGLDHDLILFRAGQRSVMRKKVRPRRVVMPIALLAMTAAAAALFVMLLARPVVERIEIVYTPVVEQKSEIEIDVDIEDATPADDRSDDSGANYWAYSPTRPYRVRALALERLDEMLRQEMNPQSRPAVAPSQGSPPIYIELKTPIPYYQRLRDLLDDQAS